MVAFAWESDREGTAAAACTASAIVATMAAWGGKLPAITPAISQCATKAAASGGGGGGGGGRGGNNGGGGLGGPLPTGGGGGGMADSWRGGLLGNDAAGG